MTYRTVLAALAAVAFLGTNAVAQVIEAPDTPFKLPETGVSVLETDEQRYERLLRQSGGGIDGQYGSTWSGTIYGTAAVSTGNSESTDIGIFARGGKTVGLYTHEVDAGYSYASDGDNTTKNKFYGGYQLNRSFADGKFGLDDRFYAYGTARGIYDQEGAFRHDYFLGAGAGYKVIDTAQTRWRLEAGPGIRFYDRPTLDFDGDVAFRFASRFRHDVSETVGFENDTYAILSSNDTNLINDSAFRVGLSENLSARLGFRINHHTNPPAGFEATDTTTYAGISYAFGR